MHDPDNTHPPPSTPVSLSPSNAPLTRSDVVLSVIGWIAYTGLMIAPLRGARYGPGPTRPVIAGSVSGEAIQPCPQPWIASQRSQ